jgi:hypothetical protein
MSTIIAERPFHIEMATDVDRVTGETYQYIKSKRLREVDVRCDCGRIVTCCGFTNSCDCGRDYNWNGSQLAPRRFWGEETGESYADIVRPSAPGEDDWQ